MNWAEFWEAQKNAETTIKQGDCVIRNFGHLLVGRLRLLKHEDLVDLKRELKAYNTKTARWKGRV